MASTSIDDFWPQQSTNLLLTFCAYTELTRVHIPQHYTTLWGVSNHRHIVHGKLDKNGLNVASIQDDWPGEEKSIIEMLLATPTMDC